MPTCVRICWCLRICMFSDDLVCIRMVCELVWELFRDDRCIGDSGREAWFPYLDEHLVAFLHSLPLQQVHLNTRTLTLTHTRAVFIPLSLGSLIFLHNHAYVDIYSTR